MAARKKKTGTQKKQPRFKGHYCKICGERKANEKFSGKGHAAHICKSCASKSPVQKSEDMTINKLHGMTYRYISETEKKWLKNRRNDSRPEVKELARQVYEEKFPRLARNEIKQTLHIKNMLFHIRGEIYDCYGDEHNVNVKYAADISGKITKTSFDENDVLLDEKSVEIGQKAIRTFFNIVVHNHEVFFWETDLCHEISYDPDIDLLPEYRYDNDDCFDFDDIEENEEETEHTASDSGEVSDDRIPAWNVEIKYKNGTEQNTKGYDYIPDPVMELFLDFEDYFEEEFIEDNEDDSDGGDINTGE